MPDSTRDVIIETQFTDSEATSPAPAPSPPKAKLSLLTLLNIAYLALLAIITFFNIIGPEYFWGTTLNLYLPQWMWTVPGIPLWIITVRCERRRIWMPTLGLLWVIGPLMGFCWSFHWHRAGPNEIRLRVLTYNVKLDRRAPGAIAKEIYEDKPDIILFQERGGVMMRGVGDLLPGWYTCSKSQYVIASRFPMVAAETRSLGIPGVDCLRCQIRIGPTLVTLYSAHLLSPRGGLAAVRHHDLEGFSVLQGGASTRVGQAERLADYIRQEQGPVLVAGDLNAPVQSMVCKRLLATGLTDAFSAAGHGYGYSYGQFTRLGMPYVRIDHILTSKQWEAVDCWAGNTVGSDHRPVIADMILSRTP